MQAIDMCVGRNLIGVWWGREGKLTVHVHVYTNCEMLRFSMASLSNCPAECMFNRTMSAGRCNKLTLWREEGGEKGT